MSPKPTTHAREADAAILAAAREAAWAAADVHRLARGRVDVSGWSEKGRSDFVTEVDLEAERTIIGVLSGHFPHHEVLAEEGTSIGETARAISTGTGLSGEESSAVRWIIDPLDGTTNWLHGYPEYAVSLAAADGVGLRAAVVLNSATGELFEAARGAGAHRDGEPVRVSGLGELRLALVGTGFPFKKLGVLPAYLDVFQRVLRSTSGIRRGGAAALDLCDLACGRLDAFWEYWLMPWDVAAGTLIVREAGGTLEALAVPDLPEDAEAAALAERLTALGVPSELRPGGFLAANPHLLGEFRQLVTGA